jgi:hypothetical protein
MGPYADFRASNKLLLSVVSASKNHCRSFLDFVNIAVKSSAFRTVNLLVISLQRIATMTGPFAMTVWGPYSIVRFEVASGNISFVPTGNARRKSLWNRFEILQHLNI